MIGHRFRFSRRRLLASGGVLVAVIALHAMILGAIALLPARPSVRSLETGGGGAATAAAPAPAMINPARAPVVFPTSLQAIVDAADPGGVARAAAQSNPRSLRNLRNPGAAEWVADFSLEVHAPITVGQTTPLSPDGVPATGTDKRISAVISALLQAADDTLADAPLAASDRPPLAASPERLVFQHVLRSLVRLAATTVAEDPELFLAILRLNDWPTSDVAGAGAGAQSEALSIYSELLQSLESRTQPGGPGLPADVRERLARSIQQHAGGPTRFSDQTASRRAIQQSLDRSHDPDGRPTAFDPSPGEGRRATGPERLRSLVALIREPNRTSFERRWSIWHETDRGVHPVDPQLKDASAIVPPRRRRELWSWLDRRGRFDTPERTALRRLESISEAN